MHATARSMRLLAFALVWSGCTLLAGTGGFTIVPEEEVPGADGGQGTSDGGQSDSGQSDSGQSDSGQSDSGENDGGTASLVFDILQCVVHAQPEVGCFCTDGPSQVCTLDAASMVLGTPLIDPMSAIHLSARAEGAAIARIELRLDGELFDSIDAAAGEEHNLTREWPDGSGFWDRTVFWQLPANQPFTLNARLVLQNGKILEVEHTVMFDELFVPPELHWRSEIVSIVTNEALEHDATLVGELLNLVWLREEESDAERQAVFDQFPAGGRPGPLGPFPGPVIPEASDPTMLSGEEGHALATSAQLEGSYRRVIDFRLLDPDWNEGGQTHLPQVSPGRLGTVQAPSIAWNGRFFAVAWEDALSRSIHLALLNEDGQPVSFGPTDGGNQVTHPGSGSGESETHRHPVLLAQGEQNFLLLWVANRSGRSSVQGRRIRVDAETISDPFLVWQGDGGPVSALEASWGLDDTDGAIVFTHDSTAGPGGETILYYARLGRDNMNPGGHFPVSEVGRVPRPVPEHLSLTPTRSSWGETAFAAAWASGGVRVAVFTPEGIPLTDPNVPVELPVAMSHVPRAPVLLWADGFFVLVYRFGGLDGSPGRPLAVVRLYLEEDPTDPGDVTPPPLGG